jgi:hypothetical protein
MPKKKDTAPKKPRTPQEQAQIDKRMAAMRAARTKVAATPRDVAVERAAHEQSRGDILDKTKAGPLKGVSLKPKEKVGQSWKAPAPDPNPVIKSWEFRTLADLANLPRHHLPMFMQIFKQHLNKLDGSQAIEKITFNEHNRFFMTTVPIDPLS